MHKIHFTDAQFQHMESTPVICHVDFNQNFSLLLEREANADTEKKAGERADLREEGATA